MEETTMAHGPYPPGPTSRLPLGLDQSVYFARRPVAWLTRAAGYGDVARVHALGYDIYLLNHPDDVREVLVTNRRNFDKGQTLRLLKGLIGEGLLTSEGDIHLRQRRLTQPAFHRQRVAEYATTITDYARRLGARWTDGARRDIAQDMRTLSLGIVAKTVLDADIDGENARLGDALNALLRWGERVILPPAIAGTMNRLPLPSTQAFNAARAYLNGLIQGIISERRATGADRGDLLSMLIHARDEDGDALSDEEVRDEALTFFLAGQETTALALTWTWYAIARNPQVEATLHDELGRVLGGHTPTAADMPALDYTNRVFSEALRLYPPAYLLTRRVVEACEIRRYPIAADSGVVISPYTMHRRPDYFPDPERFNPERWTPAAVEARPKFSYFPFGGGPRVCIGEPLARLEVPLVIATLAQEWRVQLSPNQDVRFAAIGTLRPAGGLPMTLHRRAHARAGAHPEMAGV